MLAGIGGSTIAEAQERIPYDEFLSWLAYRKKNGPLNQARRLDYAIARISQWIGVLALGKNSPEFDSFLPQYDEPDPDGFATDEDIIRAFTMPVKRGNQNG